MNMRSLALVVTIGSILTVASVLAADEATLEEQLQTLAIPENELAGEIPKEQLYAVQSRFSPLKGRFETSVGGAYTLAGERFLNSSDIHGALRYHLSDRWNLALTGSYVFNTMSESAANLFQEYGRFPDIAYAKSRVDLTVGHHLFYGKFRLSMEQTLYFDYFVALGAGRVDLNTGSQFAAVASTGFAFWLGKHWSSRLGVETYVYNEQRVLSRGLVEHLMSHLDIGYVFGGGE